MNIQQALSLVVENKNLSLTDMTEVMQDIMTGRCSPEQIAGFLVAMRMKGETLDEIAGAATVMRELATKVAVKANYLVDTCGTGGDGAGLFNVSTAAAFVVAAAGGHVAKHGNRSVSSSTGSADLLEAAGVNLQMEAAHVARAIEQIGVGFMFAPAHHGAMKHAVGPRRELGIRTLFNMLGPMTNPAGVKRQVIGVFTQKLCRPMAEVLGRLGSEHVMVVHSAEGLDEFSIVASSHVAELKKGEIKEYSVSPGDFDLAEASLSGLTVSNAEESLLLIENAFAKKPSGEKAAKIIILNAGAAIYVSGLATSLKSGVAMAEDALRSGGAALKLQELVEFSRCQ